VDDETLGWAVEEALEKSRYVFPTDDDEFSTSEKREKYYFDLAETIRVRFSYKSIRSLFKGDKFCYITSLDGILTIAPYRRERLHVHEQLAEDQFVVVSELATPARLGSQVRLAISRCL